jgi:hypothetical protein
MLTIGNLMGEIISFQVVCLQVCSVLTLVNNEAQRGSPLPDIFLLLSEDPPELLFYTFQFQY